MSEYFDLFSEHPQSSEKVSTKHPGQPKNKNEKVTIYQHVCDFLTLSYFAIFWQRSNDARLTVHCLFEEKWKAGVGVSLFYMW